MMFESLFFLNINEVHVLVFFVLGTVACAGGGNVILSTGSHGMVLGLCIINLTLSRWICCTCFHTICSAT